MVKISESIKNRVKAGAAFLSVIRPGWVKDIDLKKLDLSNANTCMIGELYGEYSPGIEKIGLDEYGDVPEQMGFYAQSTREYKVLTKAWKNFINKVRKQ